MRNLVFRKGKKNPIKPQQMETPSIPGDPPSPEEHQDLGQRDKFTIACAAVTLGTHRARDRCQEFARRYRFCLHCDICQFFSSIDHSILFGILQRALPDNSLDWLIERILHSGQGVLSEEYRMVYYPGDDLFAISRPRGLPIGNLTS